MVVPAKAGIHFSHKNMVPRLRGEDETPLFQTSLARARGAALHAALHGALGALQGPVHRGLQ